MNNICHKRNMQNKVFDITQPNKGLELIVERKY